MTKADSGINPASRFFNYRWAYIVIASLLWFNLLLMLMGSADVALFAPTYLVWNVFTDDMPDFARLGLEGVFGLDLDYEVESFASLLALVALAGAIVCFIVPEAGQTKRLPAMRGMHLRAKIVASFMIGVSAIAIIACLLDAANIDMVQFFNNIGLLKTHINHGFTVTPDSFRPESGIISLISLGSISIGIFAFGVSLSE